jgi:hypothetical protein
MSRLSFRLRGHHDAPSRQPRARNPCTAPTPEGLIGQPLPLMALATWPEPPDGVSPLARACSLVVCLYPGIGRFFDGYDELDTARALSWQRYGRECLRLGYVVVFLSARPLDSQREWIEHERLRCTLVSDPQLRLAAHLALPTIEVEGVRVYDDLTLVVHEGEVLEAFYPLSDPARDAEIVMDWLGRVHG